MVVIIFSPIAGWKSVFSGPMKMLSLATAASLFCTFNPIASFGAFESNGACGTQGTIEERIQDCASQQSPSKKLRFLANDGKGHFLLLDTKTGLVWSQYFSVREIRKFGDYLNLESIHGFCQRFQPFGVISKNGWRLPKAKELCRAEKTGHSIDNSYVLVSDPITLKRLYFNGYHYEEQRKDFPAYYDEHLNMKSAVGPHITNATFRCVTSIQSL